MSAKIWIVSGKNWPCQKISLTLSEKQIDLVIICKLLKIIFFGRYFQLLLFFTTWISFSIPMFSFFTGITSFVDIYKIFQKHQKFNWFHDKIKISFHFLTILLNSINYNSNSFVCWVVMTKFSPSLRLSFPKSVFSKFQISSYSIPHRLNIIDQKSFPFSFLLQLS